MMKKKKLYNLRKEELVEMLEKRNFQYGELSNKYASLKCELEKLKHIIKENNCDDK